MKVSRGEILPITRTLYNVKFEIKQQLNATQL
jgi:hypothetical protein